MNREELESLKEDLMAFDPHKVNADVQRVLGQVNVALVNALEREEDRLQYLEGFEAGDDDGRLSDYEWFALSRDCGRRLK